jgi:hypothetical protein
MMVIKHVMWGGVVILFTTCMNLSPSDDGRSGYHSSGSSYGGGWSSVGHK